MMKLLQHAILESGMSRYRLSKKAHVDEATLSRLMRGAVQPGGLVIDRLVAALGLEIVLRKKR